MITRKPLEIKFALVLFIFPPLQQDVNELYGDWLNKQKKKNKKSHTKFDLSVLELLFQTTYKCGLNQTRRDWIPRGFSLDRLNQIWVACIGLPVSTLSSARGKHAKLCICCI